MILYFYIQYYLPKGYKHYELSHSDALLNDKTVFRKLYLKQEPQTKKHAPNVVNQCSYWKIILPHCGTSNNKFQVEDSFTKTH